METPINDSGYENSNKPATTRLSKRQLLRDAGRMSLALLLAGCGPQPAAVGNTDSGPEGQLPPHIDQRYGSVSDEKVCDEQSDIGTVQHAFPVGRRITLRSDGNRVAIVKGHEISNDAAPGAPACNRIYVLAQWEGDTTPGEIKLSPEEVQTTH